jgi:predicted glycosyltransferase
MQLLIDIGHPAHVHLYRNLYFLLISKGHKVYVTVKDIPSAKQLLDYYKIKYIDLGTKKNSITGKAIHQLRYNLVLLNIVLKYRIDFGISSGISLPQISAITGMRSIVCDDDDDEVEPLFVKYGHRYSDVILSPSPIIRKSRKSIQYQGSHELAYLHPKWFTPDPMILNEIGVTPEEKYFVLRFVAFKGHHDIGHVGLTFEQKNSLVEFLRQYGRVFITSETKIEDEFSKYRMPVTAEKIHSLLFFASLFIGDSQTMTSEAAILGTPALKCNTFAGKLSIPNEIESQYGLCYSYRPSQFNDFYNHVKKLVLQDNVKGEWRKKREKFLNDKIDVTSFLLWFIENWPESFHIMKESPDFQYNFK